MSDSDSSAPGDGQFVVEAILDHRMLNGKIQYLLKWKDYDESENSWEYEDNLNCDELLGNYISLHDEEIEKLKDQQSQKTSKKKKSSKKSSNHETIPK